MKQLNDKYGRRSSEANGEEFVELLPSDKFLSRSEAFGVVTTSESINTMNDTLLSMDVAGRLSDYLTIAIPVKNEEGNLPACLEAIMGFKNVVIVDSGSTDATLRHAEEWGRDVVQFKWNGQFPKKRNWFLRNHQFKTTWVMFLDADERMTPAFEAELFEFLSSKESDACDVISCVFDNWFSGRMLKHGDAMRKTAVVRVGSAEYEKIDEDHWSNLDMEIHEHLQPRRAGAEHEIKARLEHHDKRSLDSHWQKHVQYANWEAGRYAQLLEHPERWASLTSRQKKKYANLTKWWLAPVYFIVCYFLKRGFLDGVAGLRFAWFKLKYFRLVRATILHQRKGRL